VFGKLISGDAEPTPEQEEKALLSSPEGEEKVYNVFICRLKFCFSFSLSYFW
jgi:E3 ubiquitin-protein ligase MYCBP2